MRDIKLTLATDRTRASTVEQELSWLRSVGELWYPLHTGKPKDAGKGSWVYFIRDGHLVARARAESIDPPTSKPKYGYSGEPQPSKAWEVRITEMEIAKQHPAHPGFQSFRYVRDEERQEFEAAFAANR